MYRKYSEWLEAFLEDTFNPDDMPEVELVDLCAVFGGHEQCPVISTAGRANIRSLLPELYVACTCECHKAGQ
jgi:hypothetical protein